MPIWPLNIVYKFLIGISIINIIILFYSILLYSILFHSTKVRKFVRKPGSLEFFIKKGEEEEEKGKYLNILLRN